MFFIPFLLVNIIAYNHAYSFTHFALGAKSQVVPPEALSIFEKIKTLFIGVKNAKPQAAILPKPSYEVIQLEGEKNLEGWLIEVPKAKGTVILYHGYGGEKSSLLGYATVFQSLGYSTFLLDFRGCGNSDGLQTTIGYWEGEDVVKSFTFITNKYTDAPVFLFGFSMGSVAIMKALKDKKVSPDGVILACPFGTMLGTTRVRFRAMGVPAFPFAELLLFYGGWQNDFNAFLHNPKDYALQINTPVLLMVGEEDKRVSLTEINEIYKNFKGQKKLVTFEKTGHEDYLYQNQTAWTAAVKDFLP